MLCIKRGEMKIYFLIAVIFLLSFSLVSASFIKANASIEKSYAPGGSLRGWLNISLQNEPANSSLTAFNSSISILDFLENSNALYTCYPADCRTGYISSNKETTKIFSLGFGQKKIIGFNITGESISGISNFAMNITSDASESSYPQLFIDILNDNSIDWQPYSASGSFGSESYGCYNKAEATEPPAEITDAEYCEKITFTLPYTPAAKIGADITAVQGGNVDFEMRAYNDEQDAGCRASANGSGKISCIANLTISAKKDFFVCIKTKTSADNGKYKINYEQNSPCGFSEGYNGYNYDFAIFAQPGNYAPVGRFTLNNAALEKAGSEITNIESYITDYINERYDNNCTKGCIIPVMFISGKQQAITISEASLSYTAGISKTANSIYDIAEIPAKISMDFQKLNLEQSNLTVPVDYGKKTLSLRLNGEEIASQEIEIAKVPLIDFIIPLNLPAAMPVKFIVFASGNITEYKWEFGDGITEETASNSTYHTYNSTGKYSLKITASNSAGESSKTFSVDVRSPKDEINRTIAEKRKELDETKEEISAVTEWYKAEIEKLAGLNEIETEINNLEKKYLDASLPEEYAGIMAELTELKVPASLQIRTFSGTYLPDAERINPGYLLELGIKEVSNPEEYKESIINWINENLDLSVEIKNYFLDYGTEQEPLLTYSALKARPKNDFGGETYLIIEESYEKLKFKENYNEKAAGDATAITFSELKQGEEKRVEFVLPEKVELAELSFYISPEFSRLPEANAEISPCNYNKKCEKESGENSKNCPDDCKPWGKAIIYLIILLFAAFVIYIALQEWYKRHYEKYLFRNKNDLFNLINFINNALHQGIRKEDVFRKLKPYGWKTEQIDYALKKAQGKRTGMWEIPVFRWFEKRKVREEIEKRQRLGIIGIQSPPRYQ